MATEFDDQAKTWGMLAHLTAISGFVCIPFGNIIGPAVVLLAKGKESPFVNDQAKESLNFQITVTIVCIIIGFVSFLIPPLIYLAWLIGLADLILLIVASIQAKSGTSYRYPFAIRLLS